MYQLPANPWRSVALALLPIVVLVVACSEPNELVADERPSVLLITVDTLRADHLGVYSNGSQSSARVSSTPQIDALAARGEVFENAVAPMPLTRPSHFSILTSRYPREHGVVNNAIVLPDEEKTLPEIFGEQGYRTGGFVSVKLLNKKAGASQGFEVFSHPGEDRQERPAEVAVGEALTWLESLPVDSPYFAWVHLFEPHIPYRPSEAQLERIGGEMAERWPGLAWGDFFAIARDNGGDIPEDVYEHARALYRGEVADVDGQVGALLRGLEKLDRRDNTIVVFTADHGESFDHGVYFEHADSLYDGAIRVPLIFAWPKGADAWPVPGTRVPEQVSSIDIAPTLLVAAGIELPENYSGRALQNASEFGDRYVLIQHPLYPQRIANRRGKKKRSALKTVVGRPVSKVHVESERVGIVGGDWKLIRTDEVSELFHSAVDPLETRDVAAEEITVLRALELQLESELKKRPLQLINQRSINKELLESLRALGYID